MRKFSIIMPTFNRPHLINRAILAIINQDYENWELIIQNGGDELPPAGDPRVHIFNEKDTGITDAMNKGMKRATGDVFNWQNDDDEMTPGTLSFVNQNLRHEWGYGYINMTDGNSTSYYWGRIDIGATYKALVEGNFVPQPSVYWTRRAYELVGDMSTDNDLTSDYDYWIRLWKEFPPQKFERNMAKYHLHPGQITQKYMAEQIRQARETSKKYAAL